MQNSKVKPPETRDFNAGAAIQWLTDMSPFFIIATTLISLAVIFLIDVSYLTKVFFPKMSYGGWLVGFLIPSGIMVARIGFGLLGASDISKGSYISGLIGLSGTFAIAIFEHYALTEIAHVWELPKQVGLFQFMIWLAVGAELRLMMTLGNENNLLNRFFSKKEEEVKAKPKPKHRHKPKPSGNVMPSGMTEEEFQEWNLNYDMAKT